MDTATAPEPQQLKRQVGLGKPRIVFALPFLALFPYNWFMYRYLPGQVPAPSPEAASHLRMHYGIFWVVTFFPFSAICFVSSAVMLIRRAGQSTGARVALVPVGLLAVGVLVLIALALSDFLR
jgi:hypothetical protein